MTSYQQGDETAFAGIYEATAAALERYAAGWVGADRARDVVQDTYLQLHRARRTYRPELPFRPWLYAIARHVAQQALRVSARRGAEVSVEEAADLASPADVERTATIHELERFIAALPPEQREVIHLADVEGMTSAEIARITGTTEGAARVRLHRAHRALRQRVEATQLPLENAS